MIVKSTLTLLRLRFGLVHRWRERADGWQGHEGARKRYYLELWRQAAAALGASFVDLGDGYCEVRWHERVTRMCQERVMLDDSLTVNLATHKPLVHRMLAEAGLPVPPHRAFDLGDLGVAAQFLTETEGPCVVKPAKGTGGGRGVTTNVRTEADLRSAAAHASLFGSGLLVEKQVPGDSYRLLYLDGELLDAVRRDPPVVHGDGSSTVRALMTAENARRAQLGSAAVLMPLRPDPDCHATLRALGRSISYVPAVGEEVRVGTVSNANSETGNESVRGRAGKALVQQGARAAAVLGIRLAGVDVLTPDLGVSLEEAGGAINEINALPGLHHHYQVRNSGSGIPVAVSILRRSLALPARQGED